ncbi:HEAT repeat domain-containing protein [Haloarchaeobius sp. TZWSO28]|uniref:HEAT repeat domain-containing protein n=1 Tax=Haloarchaeobius sp. TZWSO28 TaxID=3446119 RepID=UPI003EB8D3C0
MSDGDWDESTRDRLQTIARSFERSPDSTARELYELVAADGDAVFERIPDAGWEALDAALAVIDKDSPAGTYARATVNSLPVTGNWGGWAGSAQTIDAEALLERLESTEHQRIAAHVCARHDVPAQCIDALAACIEAEDVETRRWAAKALDWGDFALDFRSVELGVDSETVARSDLIAEARQQAETAPVEEALFEGVAHEDPDVRAAALACLCDRLWDDDDLPTWAGVAVAGVTGAVGVTPTPSETVGRLFSALEDDDPEVRAGAIGALCDGLWFRDEVPNWADESMSALAGALGDEARIVRLRAAGILDCYPSVLTDNDELWLDALTPETRAKLAARMLTVDLEETASDETLLRPYEFIAGLDPGDAWAEADTFRELGWLVDEPKSNARRALAEAIAVDPGRVADPEWYVEQVPVDSESGTLDLHEAGLLASLATTNPDTVVAAVEVLEATLDPDSSGNASIEAARALTRISRSRPDAVPVDTEQLVAAIGPVPGSRLNPRRVTALAAIDAERGKTALETVVEAFDDISGYRFVDTVSAVATDHPDVLAATIESVASVVGELPTRNRETVIDAFARLAESHPDAVHRAADAEPAQVGTLLSERWTDREVFLNDSSFGSRELRKSLAETVVFGEN